MAITFAALRSNIRSLMRDTNQADYATRGDELDREMISRLQMLAGESLPISVGWIAPAFGVSAGEDGDSFTPSAPIAAVLDIRLSDRNELLRRSDQKSIERQKEGTSQPHGRPSEYWLSDVTGQSVFNVTFNCAADQSYEVDVLAAFLPPNSTSGTLSLFEYLARAVEFDVAAACIAKMDAEDRKRLKINADIIGIYQRDSQRLMDLERARTMKLHAVAHIAPVVQ